MFGWPGPWVLLALNTAAPFAKWEGLPGVPRDSQGLEGLQVLKRSSLRVGENGILTIPMDYSDSILFASFSLDLHRYLSAILQFQARPDLFSSGHGLCDARWHHTFDRANIRDLVNWARLKMPQLIGKMVIKWWSTIRLWLKQNMLEIENINLDGCLFHQLTSDVHVQDTVRIL